MKTVKLGMQESILLNILGSGYELIDLHKGFKKYAFVNHSNKDNVLQNRLPITFKLAKDEEVNVYVKDGTVCSIRYLSIK